MSEFKTGDIFIHGVKGEGKTSHTLEILRSYLSTGRRVLMFSMEGVNLDKVKRPDKKNKS